MAKIKFGAGFRSDLSNAAGTISDILGSDATPSDIASALSGQPTPPPAGLGIAEAIGLPPRLGDPVTGIPTDYVLLPAAAVGLYLLVK